MRTNIDIDPDLIKAAMEALGTNTKKSTIEAALEQAVRRHELHKVLDLYGTVEWQGDLEERRRDDLPVE